MRTARLLALLLLFAVPLASACEDAPPAGADLSQAPDLTSVMTDLSTSPNDQSATLELADFVIDLINNHTNDTDEPALTEDKTFVDSMDPAKFAGLF